MMTARRLRRREEIPGMAQTIAAHPVLSIVTGRNVRIAGPTAPQNALAGAEAGVING